ncbi:hypothetical protein ACHAWO_012105 [Cyclotella atomus]|uniref:Uncharacterized protein n=1 Tax=Cyclotella atomus TaxID=382360 RepID=A0ABD3NLY7_9STRA
MSLSSVDRARWMAASASDPNSGTTVDPSRPVLAQTVERQSSNAFLATGPRRRAAAKSMGEVRRVGAILTGTLAAISTIGPRFSTRPAAMTLETLSATSDGSRAEGE